MWTSDDFSRDYVCGHNLSPTHGLWVCPPTKACLLSLIHNLLIKLCLLSTTSFAHNACTFLVISSTHQKGFAWNTEQVLALPKGSFFVCLGFFFYSDFLKFLEKLFYQKDSQWKLTGGERSKDKTWNGDGEDIRFYSLVWFGFIFTNLRNYATLISMWNSF